ncbi:hypothetical protein [Paenibacillus cremeus]|uniref:Uncharacterized protein n=1 Tax=Paenibacillus cremeus TaxID=2163881 RepID=A0A559KDM6_9BACL|nr:hypothetical protein [Paenibacillus cremeus]TVY10242.1 hypothetical protein FPZ49_09235 [Paenibacillus cremeus]
MAENKDMRPVSGEEVETDGIYENEWGREETLKRGDEFPFDPVMGQTEWSLASLALESQEDRMYKDTKANTDKRMHLDETTRSPKTGR